MVRTTWLLVCLVAALMAGALGLLRAEATSLQFAAGLLAVWTLLVCVSFVFAHRARLLGSRGGASRVADRKGGWSTVQDAAVGPGRGTSAGQHEGDADRLVHEDRWHDDGGR